jgi:hypothetical protein
VRFSRVYFCVKKTWPSIGFKPSALPYASTCMVPLKVPSNMPSYVTARTIHPIFRTKRFPLFSLPPTMHRTTWAQETIPQPSKLNRFLQ